MKKVILIGTVALTCAIALAGCASTMPTVYDTLNELADKEYSSITLNVSTTLNGITLTGEYVSTATDGGYQISYTYEQLATFEQENGNIVIPDSYMERYSGTAVISNGVVSSQSGDEVNLSIGQLTASGLDFSISNFSDVAESEGSFKAKVTNVNTFLGKSISASNMTIEVTYSTSQFVSLVIHYESSSAVAVLNYTFQI